MLTKGIEYLIAPKDFDILNTDNPSQYQVISIDLATARTNVKLEIIGTFLTTLDLTSGASLSLKFNNIKSQGITINSSGQVFKTLYNKIYITNSAQTGATVKIYALVNSEYIPYYNVKNISGVAPNQYHGKIDVLVTATVILAANNNRRQLVVYNNGSYDIFVGDSAVTLPAGANPGLKIPTGLERVFNTQPFFTGALYGIADGGTSQVIYWYAQE